MGGNGWWSKCLNVRLWGGKKLLDSQGDARAGRGKIDRVPEGRSSPTRRVGRMGNRPHPFVLAELVGANFPGGCSGSTQTFGCPHSLFYDPCRTKKLGDGPDTGIGGCAKRGKSYLAPKIPASGPPPIFAHTPHPLPLCNMASLGKPSPM